MGCASKEKEGEKEKEGDMPEPPAVSVIKKYSPEITVKIAMHAGNIKWPAGQSIENNTLHRAYKEDLGINVKVEFMGGSGSAVYVDFITTAIASNTVPDVFHVNVAQLNELQKSGMIEDLTDYYKEHASVDVKQTLETLVPTLGACKIDGRIYGIPQATNPYRTPGFLWIRKDWLDNVGLPEPKNMGDVVTIAKAFANNDPNLSGKKDTVGMTLNNNPDSVSFNMFYTAFGAYNNIWTEGKNGLQYSRIQPEMKNAIDMLASLYREGIIDPDFAKKTLAQSQTDIMEGKAGLTFHGQSQIGMQNIMVKNPDSNLRPYFVMTESGEVAKFPGSFTPGRIYVVKKGYSNPEIIFKAMNYWMEMMGVPDNPGTFATSVIGYEAWWTTVGPQVYYSGRPMGWFLPDLFEALETKNPVKLTDPNYRTHYDRAVAFMNGERTPVNYSSYIGFTPGGNEDKLTYYEKNVPLVINMFYGAATPGMNEFNAALNKLWQTMVLDIVQGNKPSSDFYTFVADWHRMGGEQITKEVNEWYSKQK